MGYHNNTIQYYLLFGRLHVIVEVAFPGPATV